MLEAHPPALRVTAIAWDSGFRGSDLLVGDQILAVNGAPVASLARDAGIGAIGEAAAWTDAGQSDGALVHLGLRRRSTPGTGWQALSVIGSLRAPNNLRNDTNHPNLGPGGPQ